MPVKVLTQHSVKFTRLDRIRDEIAELGDVAVSMETDVVNRQQVRKGLRGYVWLLRSRMKRRDSTIEKVIFVTKATSNREQHL